MGDAPFWYVTLPVGKVNFVENPSGERGTAGWGTVPGGGTIGTTSQYQQFGAWCGSVAPSSNGTAGASFLTFTAGAAGTDMSLSASVKGQPGIPYMLAVETLTGVVQDGSVAFTGGGTWHRYSVSFNMSGVGARRVAVRKNNSNNTGAFYVDGVQLEVGSVTTHINGDEEGCYWLGEPHNSQSARSGTTRAGGSIVSLASLGLIINSSPGIGMPSLQNTFTSFAVQDGAEFQGQRTDLRPFTFPSDFGGSTWTDYHVTRRRILNALKIDLTSPQQPCRFYYTGAEGTVTIDAVLDGGMEGFPNQGFTEAAAPIRFIADDPYWYSPTDQGTTLASQVNLGSTNFMAWRDPNGRWGTMGVSGTTIQVNNGLAPMVGAILPYNGTVLLGGSWGTIGGTVTQSVGLYYPATNTFGTFTGGTLSRALNLARVFAFERLPSGSIIVAGQYGTTNGTASGNIAQWNGAWGSLPGGTVDASVLALEYYRGTLFLGGAFAEIGGTAGARRIGFWAGAFGTLTGQGVGTLDGNVNALVMGLNRRLYMGGAFGSAAGTAANDIAYWDGAFGTLSSGITAPGGRNIQALANGLDGHVIGAGFFTNTAGGSMFSIFEWNGVQYSALGSGLGLAGGGAVVYKLLTESRTGNLYAVGRFGTAGNLLVSDGMALWNSYTWLSPDIQIAGGNIGTINAIAQTADGTIYIGGEFKGTAVAASVTQVVNSGMSEVYPILRVRNTGAGTARLYQLINPNTGAIYFNTVLYPGETATLDTRPGLRSFTSDAAGNLFGEIAPGSNLTSLTLLPGTNTIAFFADSANVQADLFWRPRHESADGGTVF